MKTFWSFYTNHYLEIDLILTLFFGLFSVVSSITSRRQEKLKVVTINKLYVDNVIVSREASPSISRNAAPLWDRFWLEVSNSISGADVGAMGIFVLICAYLYKERQIEVAAVLSLVIIISLASVTIALFLRRTVKTISISEYVIYSFTLLCAIISVYLWGHPIFQPVYGTSLENAVVRLLHLTSFVLGILTAMIAALFSGHYMRLHIYNAQSYPTTEQLKYCAAGILSLLLTSGILFHWFSIA